MAKFNLWKSNKNNLRIIPKPHACLQTMTKTPVKFWKNQNETVGGVAPTRYPLSIHFVIDDAGTMAKFNLQKKVTNNNLRIIPKPHAYFRPGPKHQWSFERIGIKL